MNPKPRLRGKPLLTFSKEFTQSRVPFRKPRQGLGETRWDVNIGRIVITDWGIDITRSQANCHQAKCCSCVKCQNKTRCPET